MLIKIFFWRGQCSLIDAIFKQKYFQAEESVNRQDLSQITAAIGSGRLLSLTWINIQKFQAGQFQKIWYKCDLLHYEIETW